MRFTWYLFFLLFTCKGFSETIHLGSVDTCNLNQRVYSIEISVDDLSSDRPNPILKMFQKKVKRTRRLTAAVLAFPFPFGIVGLHRIYLGTKPYVPVAYIGTLGGVFGIIPLIDFIVILSDKDFENFNNNGKVLMWIKD